MLQIIEARGSSYDCGLAFGKAVARNIRYRLKTHFNNERFNRHLKELHEIYLCAEKYCPKLTSELHGMAEGAKIDFWHMLFLNSPEITHVESGCTSIAEKHGKTVRLFHNEDGIPKERTEDCFLVHYKRTDGPSFFAFTSAGELPGGSFSWNEHRLFFSVNFLKPFKIRLKKRVPRTFIARNLVEARTIDEAVELLKNGHDASGYHYYLGQKDRIVSVENFRSEVSVKNVKGVDLHTNHYTHPAFAEKAHIGKHSRIRTEQASNMLKAGAEPLTILANREYAPFSICTKRNENRHTISTVEFSPKEKKVTLFEPQTLRKEKEFEL
ncbi:MAG: hypothetical protein HYV68_00485 [Candidatus Taylorbacteria bacterium]|nr:hypothetical protein [Candidatus Taylorbacteria bacterium]